MLVLSKVMHFRYPHPVMTIKRTPFPQIYTISSVEPATDLVPSEYTVRLKYMEGGFGLSYTSPRRPTVGVRYAPRFATLRGSLRSGVATLRVSLRPYTLWVATFR